MLISNIWNISLAIMQKEPWASLYTSFTSPSQNQQEFQNKHAQLVVTVAHYSHGLIPSLYTFSTLSFSKFWLQVWQGTTASRFTTRFMGGLGLWYIYFIYPLFSRFTLEAIFHTQYQFLKYKNAYYNFYLIKSHFEPNLNLSYKIKTMFINASSSTF